MRRNQGLHWWDEEAWRRNRRTKKKKHVKARQGRREFWGKGVSKESSSLERYEETKGSKIDRSIDCTYINVLHFMEWKVETFRAEHFFLGCNFTRFGFLLLVLLDFFLFESLSLSFSLSPLFPKIWPLSLVSVLDSSLFCCCSCCCFFFFFFSVPLGACTPLAFYWLCSSR